MENRKFDLYMKKCVLCGRPAEGDYKEWSFLKGWSFIRSRNYSMCETCAGKCLFAGVDKLLKPKKEAEDRAQYRTTIKNLRKEGKI